MAVARDLMLVRETGAPLHFRQITTAAALDLIREAKAKGLPVTCGITPAHLFLSDTAIGDFRTFARLSPPLRSEEDRAEEHTSELQSLMRISYAVFCLKKKKKITNHEN